MIPGEYRLQTDEITINADRSTLTLVVVNKGDRPVQVGSHYHFFEVNTLLSFDRQAAFGMRLDIPAGNAVRFEPGEEKPVTLTTFGGAKRIYGLNGLTNGPLSPMPEATELKERIHTWKGRLYDVEHD